MPGPSADQVAMMVNPLVALIAVAASPEAPLGVTATVVRPVEIAASFAPDGDRVIVLRNTAAVEVEATGASVARQDPDTTIVTSDGTAVTAITLIY